MEETHSKPTDHRAISYKHEPTITDIMAVKVLFSQTSSPLPIELVDDIMDRAEFWARSSVTLRWHDSVPGVRRDRGGDKQVKPDKMYMRMLPLGMYGVDEDLILDKHGHAATIEECKVDEYSAPGVSQKMARINTRGEYPCRKIVFDIWSRDQGWGGNDGDRGTYRRSYTWFDVSVERPGAEMLDSLQISKWPAYVLYHESDSRVLRDAQLQFTRRDAEHPFLPPPTHLQRNITASSETRHHSVTWHYNDSIDENSPAAQAADNRGQGWKSLDGSFVRSLRTGDCITLWGRARFPGWRLTVKSATITVYWAVN